MNLTKRNRLIIIFLLLVSGVLVFCTGRLTVQKIQEKMYADYSNFGQLITRTLLVQNRDTFNKDNLKLYTDNLLENSSDISFVTFKNSLGEVIYSSGVNETTNDTKINVTSPVVRNGETIGSIEIGLYTKNVNDIEAAIRNSIFLVFALGWFIFAIIIILNTIWATKELSILHRAVKEIEDGKFGTKIVNSRFKGELGRLFNAFNDMSQKLHTYEEQNIDSLTIEKNKLESVLMSIANGVVVVDSTDKVTILNTAAKNILNVEEENIINTKIQEYCDNDGENSFIEKIEEFKNTPLNIMEKKPLEFSININNRVIKTLMSPVYSKMHDYLGYIIILIDMTREAEADRLKSDFISNVSHELRTPVTVLRTYADTLYSLGEEFSYEEQKEFIGTINQEVIRLNNMVNDILDFSKFQNNVLEKEIQDIMPVIEEAVNSLKVLADEKELSISIQKKDEIPDIPFNKEAISRAIINLISNAIKYSDKGGSIKIKTSLYNNDYVQVEVEDTGMGIAPEHLDKIFDRFYRVENKTHSIKGTGLGLNLVKVTIEKRHQGEVYVTSTVGVGSTFGFRLPVKPVEENSLEEESISV